MTCGLSTGNFYSEFASVFFLSLHDTPSITLLTSHVNNTAHPSAESSGFNVQSARQLVAKFLVGGVLVLHLTHRSVLLRVAFDFLIWLKAPKRSPARAFSERGFALHMASGIKLYVMNSPHFGQLEGT